MGRIKCNQCGCMNDTTDFCDRQCIACYARLDMGYKHKPRKEEIAKETAINITDVEEHSSFFDVLV